MLQAYGVKTVAALRAWDPAAAVGAARVAATPTMAEALFVEDEGTVPAGVQAQLAAFTVEGLDEKWMAVLGEELAMSGKYFRILAVLLGTGLGGQLQRASIGRSGVMGAARTEPCTAKTTSGQSRTNSLASKCTSIKRGI